MLDTIAAGPRLLAGPALSTRAHEGPGPVPTPVPTPPVVPPAEDWVRTALVQVDFTAEMPVAKGILLTAASQNLRNDRDARGLLSDFRPLAQGAVTNSAAFLDAVRAAATWSKQLNQGNTWLHNPAIAVLHGRDGWWWAVPLREGDGSKALISRESRVPTLDNPSIAQFAVTGWQDDVAGLVSGDRFIDTRRDVNGRAGSLAVQDVPPVPPVPPVQQADEPAPH